MINKVIAIDYDDTLSLNIEAWKQIVALFHSFGAVVYIVTYRHSTQFDDMCLDITHVKDIIFTNGCGKKKYCEEIAGVEVDIWIDDSPESILYDYGELVKKMTIK